MNFSEALEMLKNGKKMARSSWNVFARKDWNAESRCYVFMVRAAKIDGVLYGSHLKIRTPTAKHTPWAPSQDDMLQDDWVEMDASHV